MVVKSKLTCRYFQIKLFLNLSKEGPGVKPSERNLIYYTCAPSTYVERQAASKNKKCTRSIIGIF